MTGLFRAWLSVSRGRWGSMRRGNPGCFRSDVDVEGMQDATVGAAVLQLDDDRLVPGMVERVQGTLGFHAPGEPRLLFKALPGAYLLTGLRPTRETHYWHKRCHPRLETKGALSSVIDDK